MNSMNAPYLTQRPPRSPRTKLGGFVILPRAIDKGRAKAVGKVGEYHYNCPLDKNFFDFVKVNGDDVYEQILLGLGDWAILQWILKNSGHKPTLWEIAQWSNFIENHAFDTVQRKERVLKAVTEINRDRSDILTSFDLLDLDDYVSYGGLA